MSQILLALRLWDICLHTEATISYRVNVDSTEGHSFHYPVN